METISSYQGEIKYVEYTNFWSQSSGKYASTTKKINVHEERIIIA